MRNKPAGVLSNQVVVLANADPAGVAVHHPAADHRKVVVEVADWAQLLIDPGALRVNPVGFRMRLPVLYDGDVGSLASKNRLFYVGRAHRFPRGAKKF